jgi:hypothetical protein
MEQNILLLSVLTLVCYFIVGNPYTYAIMSKITTLKVKDKKQHMLLVGIHAVVMTLLMYGAYVFLIQDKECPKPKACPPPKKCPEVKQAPQVDDQSIPPKATPPSKVTPPSKASPPSQPSNGSDAVEGFSF